MLRFPHGGRPTAASLTRPATRSARPAPWRALCLVAAAAGLSTATATAAAATPPDPADPAAAVPAVAYRPTLAGYRAWAPPEPRSWREINDTVARIGGWRVYLREAHAPDPAAADVPAAAPAGSPAAPATRAAPSAPAAGSVGGHGHHGGPGGRARP